MLIFFYGWLLQKNIFFCSFATQTVSRANMLEQYCLRRLLMRPLQSVVQGKHILKPCQYKQCKNTPQRTCSKSDLKLYFKLYFDTLFVQSIESLERNFFGNKKYIFTLYHVIIISLFVCLSSWPPLSQVWTVLHTQEPYLKAVPI